MLASSSSAPMLQITSHFGLADSARTRLMMSPEPAFTTSALMPVAFSNSGIKLLDDVGGMRRVDADALLRRRRGHQGRPEHGGKRQPQERSVHSVFSCPKGGVEPLRVWHNTGPDGRRAASSAGRAGQPPASPGMRIEAFSQAKDPADPGANEDQFLVLPGLGYAVIDGVSDIEGRRYEGGAPAWWRAASCRRRSRVSCWIRPRRRPTPAALLDRVSVELRAAGARLGIHGRGAR